MLSDGFMLYERSFFVLQEGVLYIYVEEHQGLVPVKALHPKQ